MPLWGAVIMMVFSNGGAVTYAPFYDLNACLTAQQDMAVYTPWVKCKCVPTVTGNPGAHNVQ